MGQKPTTNNDDIILKTGYREVCNKEERRVKVKTLDLCLIYENNTGYIKSCRKRHRKSEKKKSTELDL